VVERLHGMEDTISSGNTHFLNCPVALRCFLKEVAMLRKGKGGSLSE
jgi:hypothetical protein